MQGKVSRHRGHPIFTNFLVAQIELVHTTVIGQPLEDQDGL